MTELPYYVIGNDRSFLSAMLGPQDSSDGAGRDCDSMFMMMSQCGDVFISESSVLALFE